MKRILIVPLAIAISILLNACSSSMMQPGQMMMGIDRTTMGSGLYKQNQQQIIITLTNDIHQTLAQGQSIEKDDELPTRYAQFIERISRNYGLQRVADWQLASLGVRCLVFEINQSVDNDILQQLRNEPIIETVQTLNYFSVSVENNIPSAPPDYNDPYFDLQPGHKTLQVSASHVWATGKGVRVAIIDSGVDFEHRDLTARLTGTRNFVDLSNTEFKSDIHGTAVAGIIGATANNSQGIVGIAPEAELIALKACAQKNSGSGIAVCTSFTLAKALNFAIEQQVDIINLSLTGPSDALLERLVNKALDSNILVVGATGRTIADYFPGKVGGVITVGAIAEKVQQPSAILAPGEQIISTSPNDAYDFFTGSSFATAHVTGITALIRQHKADLSANDIKNLLQGTAEPGSGQANACRALSRVVSHVNCPSDTAKYITDQ